MLPTILIGVAVVVVVLVLLVASRPAEMHIGRSTRIAASPATVFAEVNDFHRWEQWSPYEKRDLAMKKTFEGPPAGVGASYTWSGNNQVGEGRMTMMESRPNDLIRIKLEFQKPFKATNTAEFTFVPDGNQTVATWSITGKNNFMAKAMGLMINMDKMIGKDFEQGLAQLKAVAETGRG